MGKIFLTFLLAGLSFVAFAQQQGFSGSTSGLSSVAQAKTLRDDAWVVLEGNIIKQVGHELYEFRDISGTMYVDIDDKRWMGQIVSSEKKVRIEGEVDKDWNSVVIDVKKLRVLK